MRERHVRGERGLTFVEMIATAAILLILASVILPTARTMHKRQREIELRRVLREMRTAIDEYNCYVQGCPARGIAPGQIAGMNLKLGSEGYPPDLETLVNGVELVGGKKKKFLRRIPRDPMTESGEWGLRCYQDDPDSTSWCGENVFDVYTTSDAQALDETEYSEW
jgi:general secretion pathway protein G